MKSLINFLAGFIVALAIVTLWLKANIDAVLDESLAFELKHGSLYDYYKWWCTVIITLCIFCVIRFIYELGASTNHNLENKNNDKYEDRFKP